MSPHTIRPGVALFVVLLTFPLILLDAEWVVLWPSACALLLVFVLRSALLGLLGGAVVGSLLLAGGNPIEALRGLVVGQVFPIFASEWKLSAIAFTLLLGGFVALVEASGGLLDLIRRMLPKGQAIEGEVASRGKDCKGQAIGVGAGRGFEANEWGQASGVGREQALAERMQLAVLGFGLLVFFDGLANTMLLGRLFRGAADRCGVSRVKLAYLADSTGSAVACVAFISTWIAFQLAMIREGFAAVGMDVGAYRWFFRSLPTNFYCWFALVMALVSILRKFNPGPMGRYERDARVRIDSGAGTPVPPEGGSHWAFAIVPIFVLVAAIPFLVYGIGADTFFPFSPAKFVDAYGRAESYVPQILVVASLTASLVAAIAYARVSRSRTGLPCGSTVFFGGIRDLVGPVLILLAAWMLGRAISDLGAALLIAELLQGRLPPGFLPAGVFLVGALISFSTGTSWGTMAVLMPLAVPVVFAVSDGSPETVREGLLIAAIGAVFSGAVFGDHCSPFSDTTIVASIAAGVEPFDHVRTQMPFALIAALVAVMAGFIPLGFGMPAWVGLLAGSVIIFFLPNFMNRFGDANTNRRQL